MSPIAVFFRTLMKSSAICLGAGFIFIHPSLDWSRRHRPASARRRVTAQQSPSEGAMDGLIFALKDSDAGVRKQAAFALGELKSTRAVPALIEMLKDADVEVRQRAMSALGEIGDARAAAAIAGALKDTDARVRARAASALAEIGDKSDRRRAHRGGSRLERRGPPPGRQRARRNRRRPRAAGVDRRAQGRGRRRATASGPGDRRDQRR